MTTPHSADANTHAHTLTSALPIKGHKRTTHKTKSLKERRAEEQARGIKSASVMDFLAIGDASLGVQAPLPDPALLLTSSLNPNHLQPLHSVSAKLLADPDAYSAQPGDMQQTTLYNIPEYWFVCVDKIRAECLDIAKASNDSLNNSHFASSEPKQPGFHRTLACCLDLGFNHYILPNPYFQSLAAFQRQKLTLDSTIDGVRFDGLNEFLNSFNSAIPNNSSHVRKRQNLYIPTWLAQQVSEFSLQLGPKLNSFIITSAIMLILSTQNCLFEAHQKRLREASKILLDNVKLRARLCEVVMQFIKEGKD